MAADLREGVHGMLLAGLGILALRREGLLGCHRSCSGVAGTGRTRIYTVIERSSCR
jgi:hypothetical protein